MKKIIIPFWYPNKLNSWLDTFFHDQATLFEKDYDARHFIWQT